MAQDIIIRTWCDVCLEQGDTHTEGVTTPLGDGLEIDLCEPHRKPITDMLPLARQREPKRQNKPGYECPTCGKVLQTERGFRKHRTQQHGDDGGPGTLFGVEGTDCPDCGRTFDTRQGVSMHRFRVHGIRSDGSRVEQESA